MCGRCRRVSAENVKEGRVKGREHYAGGVGAEDVTAGGLGQRMSRQRELWQWMYRQGDFREGEVNRVGESAVEKK